MDRSVLLSENVFHLAGKGDIILNKVIKNKRSNFPAGDCGKMAADPFILVIVI